MEKININNIIKRFEIKIAYLLIIMAFLVVFFMGLINHVGLQVIIKRSIIAELFFIPLGLLAAYIYRSILEPVLSHTVNNEEMSDKRNDILNDKAAENQEEQGIKLQTDNRTGPNLGAVIDEMSDDTISMPDLVKQYGAEEPANIKKGQEYHESENAPRSVSGKHIIVNDKKIINDPKLMADAVRTMMNKEDA